MRSDTDPVIGARSGANGDASSTGGAAAKAKEGAEQLKNAALERVDDVRERAFSQRERVADRVRRVSSVVRSAGDQLRGEDEAVARYIDMAGDRIDRAAEYLSTMEPQQVVRDVEGFARRQPAVFFGGAFLLGLAVARFVKSSQQSSSEIDDIDMSRDFFEDDNRFERAYAGASTSTSPDVTPSPDVWGSSPSESTGAIPGSPTIDVGSTGVISGVGQDWPERKD